MDQRHDAQHWENRYQTNDLPWDSGVPEPELVQVLPTLGLPVRAALDIGCGTGTNALWLVQQRLSVTGTDIAPKAIDLAQQKAGAARVRNVKFLCVDILKTLPVPAGSVGLVFDRGCFHVMADESKPTFAKRVHEALAPSGWWLSLAGNIDQDRGGAPGPPQLSAALITSVIEPLFEIHHLRRIHFQDRNGPTHLAWSCLAQRRAKR